MYNAISELYEAYCEFDSRLYYRDTRTLDKFLFNTYRAEVFNYGGSVAINDKFFNIKGGLFNMQPSSIDR